MEKLSGSFYCSRHGEYGERYPNQLYCPVYVSCPKCDEVREKGLCTECEKHIGTVDYSEGTMDWIHVFISKLCQCCYVNKVEAAFNMIGTNLEKQKAILAENPCKTNEEVTH